MQGHNVQMISGVQRIIGSSLLYAKHLRLMLLAFVLGVSAGLVYFTYSRSVYHSRSLVRLDAVEAPFQGSYDISALVTQLSMRSVAELAAKRVGLVGERRGSYEYIRDAFVKRIDVKQVSANTLSIDVFPYRRDLLETFPRAMLDAVLDDLGREFSEGHRKQLARWDEEMALLRKQMEEVGKTDREFASRSAATELFIEQQGLAQLPRELILSRARLDEFDQVQQRLERGDMDTISKLALLDGFLDSGRVKVGSQLGAEAAIPPGTGPAPKGPADPLAKLIPALGAQPAAGPDFVVVPSMVESLRPWQQLERRRRVLLEQIESGSRTMLPGHRRMVDLNRALADVEQGLSTELEVSLRKFGLEFTALKDRVAKLQSQLPNYQEVMGKYQQFRDDYALRSGSQLQWGEAYVRIAQELTRSTYARQARKNIPEPQFLGFTVLRLDPVSPPKGKLAVMSLLIGLGLALLFPMLVERLNDTVSRIEDLENSLNLPGLGIVPVYNPADLENLARSPEIDASTPDWLMESFRTIRSGIALNRDVEAASQVVMVSSARPREGKTTVAMNLAWAFASMGERTLLLDCDLRRGRLHSSLGLENTSGLTDVLMRATPWADALRKTAQKNLDVICRGPIIPGATESLCRDGFADLIREWRGHYNRIVLDTPPVLGLSEPASLQRVVDGVVLVVLAEQTAQKDVTQALSILRKSGGRFFGFVLNRLDLRDLHNYYNYSTYSPYYYSVMEGSDTAPSRA
jgi:succinoglycan biosynthesis transport protein ExoP